MGIERFKGGSISFKAMKSGCGAGWLATVLLAFGCLATYVNAAVAETPVADVHSNPGQGHQWLQEHLLVDKAQLPFSFAYDRQGSSGLLQAWTKKTETRQLDAVRTEYIVTWADPKSGL